MKKFYMILLAVLALSLTFAFVACGGNDDDGGNNTDPVTGITTYKMEAEYIDLDGIVGGGLSNAKEGVDMIEDGKNASNGYFVAHTYVEGLTLEFVFEAEEACSAELVLSLGSELGDMQLGSDIFAVKLNGAAITYANKTVYDSDFGNMEFQDISVTSNAQLAKGKNTVTLVVLKNEYKSGSSGGPLIDYLKIKTTGKITWTDKTDNPDRRGEI